MNARPVRDADGRTMVTSVRTDLWQSTPAPNGTSPGSFRLDLEMIRGRARRDMDRGPVTATYESDVDTVVSVLNNVLASEIVCWLRYQQHAIVATGIGHAPVAAEFVEHAAEELQHALSVAERIDQLGGVPDLNPDRLMSRSQTPYRTHPGTDLERMVQENLVAERIVIQTYQEIVRWLGDGDITSRRLIERILAEEEEHAADMQGLLPAAAAAAATTDHTRTQPLGG